MHVARGNAMIAPKHFSCFLSFMFRARSFWGSILFCRRGLVGVFLVRFPIFLVSRPILVLPGLAFFAYLVFFVMLRIAFLVIMPLMWRIVQFSRVCALLSSALVLSASCNCSLCHWVSFSVRMRSSRMSYLNSPLCSMGRCLVFFRSVVV